MTDSTGGTGDVLAAMADVYRAGARKSRQWPFNHDRQQEADVLEAMAVEADKQALRLYEQERARLQSPGAPT